VVGARINHTIPLRSGHSQINAHPTRLVKASAEQCSKSKKEPEVLVATMQPNTKGTEPTFSNPSFFFKKKETQFKLLQSRTTEGRWLNSHFLNKEDQKLAWG